MILAADAEPLEILLHLSLDGNELGKSWLLWAMDVLMVLGSFAAGHWSVKTRTYPMFREVQDGFGPSLRGLKARMGPAMHSRCLHQIKWECSIKDEGLKHTSGAGLWACNSAADGGTLFPAGR